MKVGHFLISAVAITCYSSITAHAQVAEFSLSRLDAARLDSLAGLSVVVTAEGHVSGIYVLKSAPFGLTAQAIKATRNWRLKPGQKDGKPVSIRTNIEIGFHLLN